MSAAARLAVLPAPALERRDSFGRRIAMTWESAPDSAHTRGARWLVAVDGSACAARAAAAMVRLAAMGQSQGVDLVNVQPWLGKEAAETGLQRYGWEATHQARQLLDEAAIAWRLHVVMGEAATSIVQLAEALGSLGICLGTHGHTPAKAALLGSVSSKVLQWAQVPVLLVR